jgi:hypothetical protein
MSVGRADDSRLAEAPFSLGIFFSENMAVKGMRNFEFTAGRFFKALGSPAVGLNLWQLKMQLLPSCPASAIKS